MPVPVQRLPLDPGPPLPKPGRANVMGPDRHMLDTACVEGNGHSPSNDSPRVRSDAPDAAHVQSSGYMGSSRVWTPTISDGHGSSLSRGHNHVGHFEPRPNSPRTPTSSFTDKWVGYSHQRGSKPSFETESIPDDRSAQRRSSAQPLLEDREKQQAEHQSPPPTTSQRPSTSLNNQSQAQNDFDKGLRNERTSRRTRRYEFPSLTTTQPPSREHDPQPETRPISEDQLVAKVKGIYAGLAIVETKCIDVDNAQPPTADTNSDTNANSTLNNEHMQALIALHRTLLHEHHDFFLASQHQSTSPALQRLASKYAMPARMWRHGIHSFLELLRRGVPVSLEYMLTFLYLAYSIVALLYETAPAFEDTWIECLGDLGRYRMAIEDNDLQDRKTWIRLSRHWYSKASDKSPTTGRLYHHLAILARLNTIQQLSYYIKSLGVAVSLRNAARESIMTLFDSVLAKSPNCLAPIDAEFMRDHGTLFSGTSKERLQELCDGLLEQLGLDILRSTRRWRGANYYIGLDLESTLVENDPDVTRWGMFKTPPCPTLERGPRSPPSLVLNHFYWHHDAFLNDFRLWWKPDFSQLPEDFALRRPVQDPDHFLRRPLPGVWIPKGFTLISGEREAKLRLRCCNVEPEVGWRHRCRTHKPNGLSPDIESVEATSQELLFPSYLVHPHEMDCVATEILALLRIIWWASTRSFFLLFRTIKQVPSGSWLSDLLPSPAFLVVI